MAEEAGVDVEIFARQGDPADAILDVAEEQGADLIVVGNKGMTGAKRFLLGSVPNKVSPPRALQRADHPHDLSGAGCDGSRGERGSRRRAAGSVARGRVEQARAVARVVARRAEVARGRLEAVLDRASGRGLGPMTPQAMTSAAAAETCGTAIDVPW